MSINDNQCQSMIINDSTIFFGGFPNYLYLPESFFCLGAGSLLGVVIAGSPGEERGLMVTK